MIKNKRWFRRIFQIPVLLIFILFSDLHAYTVDEMTEYLKDLYLQADTCLLALKDYPEESPEKVKLTRILHMLRQDARKLKRLKEEGEPATYQAELEKMKETWDAVHRFLREMERLPVDSAESSEKIAEELIREIEAYRQRIEHLEARLDEIPVPVDRLTERQRVEKAVMLNDWKTVKTRLDKALVYYPDDPELHFYLALFYCKENHLPGARDAILEAIRLNPRNSRYWEKAGDIYTKMSLFEQAFGSFAEVLLLNPGNIDARLKMAGLLIQRADFDSARRIYKEVIRLNPDHPGGYEGLGHIEWKEGNIESAKTFFQKAITRNSSSANLYMILGTLYMNQKQYSYAIRHLEQVIRLDPDHLEARFLLGKAYWHRSDFSRASVYWSQVYRMNNRAYEISFWLPAAYYVQAELLNNENHHRESTRAFRNALEINPDSYHWMAWGNYWLGKVYLDQNNPVMAEKYYTRALETNPNLSEALIAIGILRWQQNRVAEAKNYWQKALKINPSNPEASAWMKMTRNNP